MSLSDTLGFYKTMDTKRQADVDPLYLAVTSNLNSSADELDKFVKQINSLSYGHINSAIERIDKLDVNEIELKQKLRECVEKLEMTGTSAGTFVESTQNFFTYADLDPDQEATIKEYYRTGNYEGIKSHINKVQAFLEQTHKCYEEFVKKFEAAKASCDDVAGNCNARKAAARNKKIATRVVGSGAAVTGAGVAGAAGVVGAGVAASVVAGVFTFGIGTIVGLAITSAAVGTVGVVTAGAAGATTYLVSRNFEKLEKTFRDFSSDFVEVANDISNLGLSMNKLLEKLKVTGKWLDSLKKRHVVAEQGDEYKHFTKAFEMLLEAIRKGRSLAYQQPSFTSASFTGV